MDFFFDTILRADIAADGTVTTDLIPGDYTLSCDLKTNIDNILSIQIRFYNWQENKKQADLLYQFTNNPIVSPADGAWHKFKMYLSIPFRANWGKPHDGFLGKTGLHVGLGFTTNYAEGKYFSIKKMKFEYGRADNPIWTPSPADISLIYDRLAKVAPIEAMSESVADVEGSE